MSNYQIAKTILQQLGNRFMIMTGCYQPTAVENGLRLRLRRNASKANYLYIRLNSMDTYDMEFVQVRGGKTTQVALLEGYYVDMLHAGFRSVTGMATNL